MNHHIVACGRKVDIGAPVVLWNEDGGFSCPNRRGRKTCTHHDPILNDQPTLPDSAYNILDPDEAYEELKSKVHQFVLHYDVCYSSYHCHQLMKDSTYKGSQFYLDLDGTIYQTCDLYWKTNTGPADDRVGNERAVHVEMSNLSWEARAKDSEMYKSEKDLYQKKNGTWQLDLPQIYRDKIRTPNFKPVPSRAFGERGYFSRRVNGHVVRMWDFTEEQYQALIRLCVGLNHLLPNIKPRVPFDKNNNRVPLDRIKNYSTFSGILGHAHVQHGTQDGIGTKYDPGSAFNWSRLRRALQNPQQYNITGPHQG